MSNVLPPVPGNPNYSNKLASNPYQPPSAMVGGMEPNEAGELPYAGFWVRFAAVFLDGILLALTGSVLSGLLAAGLLAANQLVAGLAVMYLLPILIAALYHAVMESRESGATLGKMALGLGVRRVDGTQIGFGRGLVRYFGRIVSSLPLLIGYLIQPFNQRKQALHDMLAGTVVVVRRPVGSAGVIVGVVVGLFVVIFMVGILAALALPAYQDYTTRSKVHTEYIQAQQAAAKIATFYGEQGRLPGQLSEANVEEQAGASSYSYDPETGSLEVELAVLPNHPLGLVLEPVMRDGAIVRWRCQGADGTPAKYLPRACGGGREAPAAKGNE